MTIWTERDQPVLRWLVEHPPVGGVLSMYAISGLAHGDAPFSDVPGLMRDGLPSLTQADMYVALMTLIDAGYLSATVGKLATAGHCTFVQLQVTGQGKQALGLWPRFDALGEPPDMAAMLEGLSDYAPNDEEASNLKTAAQVVRSAAPGVIRGLVEAAMSAAIRHGLGLG